jgi:hypothetical protein
MLSEGGELAAHSNINFLLEEYGIACNPGILQFSLFFNFQSILNSDSVIRTVFYKYFDPKEAYVSNGVLNRSLPTAIGVRNNLSVDRPLSKTSRPGSSANRRRRLNLASSVADIDENDASGGNNL